jgi:DNA adenine methylase
MHPSCNCLLNSEFIQYLHQKPKSKAAQERLMRIIFNSTNYGKIGEHAFECYLQMLQIPFIAQSRHTIDDKTFIIDFETEHKLYEIKFRSYYCPGTAGEKIYFTPYKYKKLCEHLKKPLVIVLMAYQEEEFWDIMDNSFIDSVKDWAKYKCFTEMLKKTSSELTPMLKWVGGKSKLLNSILPLITPHLNNDWPWQDSRKVGECKYIEPFLGGGSVLIGILNYLNNIKRDFSHIKIRCSDLNEELINVYNSVKYKPKELIETLQSLCSTEITEDRYYKLRTEYNQMKANAQELPPDKSTGVWLRQPKISTLKAALFIILNKTGFRGLYRVNKSGELNVPYGHYRNPQIFDISNIVLCFWNFNLYDVTFKAKSYVDTENNHGIFYLDPPYLNTFDDYCNETFDYSQFDTFVNNIRDHSKVIISNSEDYEKYQEEMTIIKFNVRDSINSKHPEAIRKEILLHNL